MESVEPAAHSMTDRKHLMEETVLQSPSTPRMGPHPGYSPRLSTERFKCSPHRPLYKDADDHSQPFLQKVNSISMVCGGLRAEDLVYVKCNQRKWVLGSVRQVTERGIKVWLHSPQTMANVSLSIAFTHILAPLEKVVDCRHLPRAFSLSEIPPSGIYELGCPVEIVRPSHLAHRRLFHSILLASLHVHDQGNSKQHEQTPTISVPNSSTPSPSIYDSSSTPKRRLSFSPHEENSLPFQHNLPTIREPTSLTLPANDNCNNISLLGSRISNNAGPVESQDRNRFFQRSLSLSPVTHTTHGGSSPNLRAAQDHNRNMGLIPRRKSIGNLTPWKKSSPPQYKPRLTSAPLATSYCDHDVRRCEFDMVTYERRPHF